MAKKKREFTIERGSGRGYDRTIVGKDGKKQGPYPARKNKQGEEMKGRDGHFTSRQEGGYRDAIERAEKANSA